MRVFRLYGNCTYWYIHFMTYYYRFSSETAVNALVLIEEHTTGSIWMREADKDSVKWSY